MTGVRAFGSFPKSTRRPKPKRRRGRRPSEVVAHRSRDRHPSASSWRSDTRLGVSPPRSRGRTPPPRARSARTPFAGGGSCALARDNASFRAAVASARAPRWSRSFAAGADCASFPLLFSSTSRSPSARRPRRRRDRSRASRRAPTRREILFPKLTSPIRSRASSLPDRPAVPGDHHARAVPDDDAGQHRGVEGGGGRQGHRRGRHRGHRDGQGDDGAGSPWRTGTSRRSSCPGRADVRGGRRWSRHGRGGSATWRSLEAYRQRGAAPRPTGDASRGSRGGRRPPRRRRPPRSRGVRAGVRARPCGRAGVRAPARARWPKEAGVAIADACPGAGPNGRVVMPTCSHAIASGVAREGGGGAADGAADGFARFFPPFEDVSRDDDQEGHRGASDGEQAARCRTSTSRGRAHGQDRSLRAQLNAGLEKRRRSP